MKFPLFTFACLMATASLFSQSNIQQSVSINSTGAAANASAQLDVSATDKGMLVPRMTTAQRTAIASPANGLLVYDTTTGGFWFYNGSTWTSLNAGAVSVSQITDADNDTKVQTEASPDEDIIRFDLGGTEKMVLQKNASGATRLELPDDANSTIIGDAAGVNNQPVAGVSGEKNTFVGYRSGNGNTTGSGNSAFGASTLDANTSGAYNTALGINGLYGNTTGNENTAVGSYALTSNTIGQFNTAQGSNSLLNNSSGTYNSAYGRNALYSNTTGSNNTANGASALFSNTIGNSNVAIGTGTLYRNTEFSNLVAVGDSALYNNGAVVLGGFYSINNTAIGARALVNNTFGSDNTANGTYTLYSNTIGSYNTSNGTYALYSNTTGGANIANGYRALYSNTTGSHNTANGSYALYSNTTGSYNTATGSFALYLNTTGGGNIANGGYALHSNTTGGGNIANGGFALEFNTTGSNNTANGGHALGSNTTGSNNTANGYLALSNNQTGSWNTALGEYADVSSNSANARTMLGARAYSECDNCVVIGSVAGKNGAGATAKIGIGTSNPTHTLEVGADDAAKPGSNTWSAPSDARLKDNMLPFTDGLAAVLQIKPITYHYTYNSGFDPQPEYVGIVAQELQQVAPYMVSERERKLKDGTSGNFLTVNNGAMTYMLINAVKELAAENEELKSQINKITDALKGAGISLEKQNP